ncbi:homocysteine S-methyltransferase family protein [Raoultibacter phocaeensis]|uniref:homocysteine S-methyltransferase family protein n=1 Tax=Raoultibacter phocaeensis TaxID=2479841 RepID=UPI002101F8A9|nr:homocysteine S-methyltransferase family protein [Raoultibacter phocaeensis]
MDNHSEARAARLRVTSFCKDMPYDRLAGLTIKDDHLAAVLRGEAYLVQDGAMGTILQARELVQPGQEPDLLTLSNPEGVTAIHADYVAAGAQMLTTNTFCANRRKLDGQARVEEVFAAAIRCAKEAGGRYIAANIGPIGALLEPLGTLSFDEAYDLFAEQVVAARDAGADLLAIETFTDLLEAKAAVLAAKENCDLPIFISMTFGEDGRTFLGTSPEVAAITLSSLGAHAVGVNCSLGPDELAPIVESMVAYTPCPVVVRPNAGLPRVEGDRTVYDVTPDEYGRAMERIFAAGATVLGGCCGTTPAYIEKIAALAKGRVPEARRLDPVCAVTGSQEAVILKGCKPATAVIGERINPTGKPRLKEALVSGNLDYAIGEAIAQEEAGAQILDVNVGLPEIDEPAVLLDLVKKLQVASRLPLQIDSSDPEAIETAVRRYAGKPIINSVNGKRESLEAILPIAKHYGCALVALTLDENGIPPTAEERFAIAERIVQTAETYGITRHDIVIDCLVMAVSTNQQEAREILKAVTLVKERLGVRTTLGVSNVSFGLPQRELVNATFLAAAFGAGLDMPILNPLSERYMDVVKSFRVLDAEDRQASAFIEEYAAKPDPYRAGKSGSTLRAAKGAADALAAADAVASDTPSAQTAGLDSADVLGASPALDRPSSAQGEAHADDPLESIRHFIMTGRKEQMAEATERLLAERAPMEIVNDVFIPILDLVGAKFERGEFFLPQMMASAEAVKAGFDTIRAHAEPGAFESDKRIVLATVKGDIHDIGKNIVRMLLENYGYRVIDLGRDVSPEAVLAAVREHDVHLVGLSALMTTTVKAMEETIRLLREQAPDCAVFVGGAVLNPEYAAMIGADYYGKDAAEAARIAGSFFEQRG